MDCYYFVADWHALTTHYEEREADRQVMRSILSFYGSTPNYAFIWDEAGFEGTTERVREHQKQGDMAGMAAQITDDHLATFCTESTWDGLAQALVDRYGPKPVLLTACVLEAAGTVAFGFVQTPVQAFGAATLTGAATIVTDNSLIYAATNTTTLASLTRTSQALTVGGPPAFQLAVQPPGKPGVTVAIADEGPVTGHSFARLRSTHRAPHLFSEE